ncbi:hypothetical protein Hanom_Chr02g00103231 [Helianthus anomalus]
MFTDKFMGLNFLEALKDSVAKTSDTDMIQCKMLVIQDLRLVIKLMKWMKLKMGWWMATCCDGCNGGWQRCSEQPHSRSMANNYKRIIGMSKFPLTNTSNFLLEFSSITNNW